MICLQYASTLPFNHDINVSKKIQNCALVVFQLSSASYVVCLAGCLRCSCINNGCDKIDENGREIHFFDSHSKYVHPLSRKGKAGTFLYEYGDSSLQYSFGQEKSSDQSLS
jgi:hypothetical protein